MLSAVAPAKFPIVLCQYTIDDGLETTGNTRDGGPKRSYFELRNVKIAGLNMYVLVLMRPPHLTTESLLTARDMIDEQDNGSGVPAAKGPTMVPGNGFEIMTRSPSLFQASSGST